MRRMREDHLHRNYSDVNERPIRCRAKLIQPKAGMAARLAMIPSAYNGTFCPATAASNGGSSERSSEGLDSRWALPGAGSFNRPTVREVVSNRTEQKNFKKYNEGRSISGYSNMLPTKTGAALSTLRQKYGDRPPTTVLFPFLLSSLFSPSHFVHEFFSPSSGRSSYLCRKTTTQRRDHHESGHQFLWDHHTAAYPAGVRYFYGNGAAEGSRADRCGHRCGGRYFSLISLKFQ